MLTLAMLRSESAPSLPGGSLETDSRLTKRSRACITADLPCDQPHKKLRSSSKNMPNLLSQRTFKPQHPAHMFSNKSTLVHILLPLLLAASDDITRIQLRSTCRLYRSIHCATRFQRLSVEDLGIHPFLPGSVSTRDWDMVLNDNTDDESEFDEDHNKHVLRPTYVSASLSELDRVLVPGYTFKVYVYARPPCIPEDDWHEDLYQRPQKTPSGCHLLVVTGVPHTLFGRVDKEIWTMRRPGSGGFTIRDIAQICAGRWSAYPLCHLDGFAAKERERKLLLPLSSTHTSTVTFWMRCTC